TTFCRRDYHGGEPMPMYQWVLNTVSSFQVLYVINVRDKDDPYIETAEKAMSYFNAAANPGAFLVDVLTICAPSRLNPGLLSEGAMKTVLATHWNAINHGIYEEIKA
ncbi:hypothetical protein JB92DRAFT_2890346, partial [Gautieria morchelliformis]